jgi:hypothetical protein
MSAFELILLGSRHVSLGFLEVFSARIFIPVAVYVNGMMIEASVFFLLVIQISNTRKTDP